jgi:uncharacterized phiE125 gp8 family phage protein
MWHPSKITEAATAEPVTQEEAKDQCRVDADDDNDLIDRLIKTARDHVERYCGARFASQTVEMKCDCFGDFVRLPEGPVTDVKSVTYVDTAGAAATLSAGVYELHDDGLEPSIGLKPGQRWPLIWPGSRITVEAVVGYDAAPDAVRHAMLLLIGTWYAQRENTLIGATVDNLPMPSSVDALLCNFRRGV